MIGGVIMTINFIPNDPKTQNVLPMRKKKPRENRPNNLAGFNFEILRLDKNEYPPEGAYSFETQGFLYWQSREAALAAIETWESIDGKVSKWARSSPNPRKLRFVTNYGFNEINAYYTGRSLLFYIHKTDDIKVTQTGASTDVVSHESGHALLDVIRPDLWTSNFHEVASFHEAFGDCISLLTSLSDLQTRKTVSQVFNSKNFLESLGEDLADGILHYMPTVPPQWRDPLKNSSGPRHALNNFKWQLPETLPPVGPPNKLISSIHSFSQVFTGCFYDTLLNIFNSLPQQNEKTLWQAAKTAGAILINAAKCAPESPRFFRDIGRAMIITDEQLSQGANHLAIRNAFTHHDIALGSSAMLTPIAGLIGPSPKLTSKAKGAILNPKTRKDLLARIKASPGDKLSVRVVKIGSRRFAEALHLREVPLGKLDKRLKGAVAVGVEPILVGSSGNRAAIMGSLPEPTTTHNEVLSFVGSLLRQNSITFDDYQTKAKARHSMPATHKVYRRGNKKILTRIGFAC